MLSTKKQDFFKKLQPLITWGVGDLYFILSVTVAMFFGVFFPDLQKQLGLTNAEIGFLGFGFFISFGATQLLIGSLVDSWGPRITLSLSACIAGAGLFSLSTANSFSIALISQIITGIGFSISYVGAIYLASIWFAPNRFSLLSGATQMSANLISALLITSIALIKTSDRINFRSITTILGFIAILTATILFLFVRKPLQIHQSKENKPKPNFWNDLYKLLRIPQFWLGAIYFSASFSVFLSFSSLWNIPDSIAYGHSFKTSMILSATLRFGGALGALLSGAIASYLGRCAILAKFYNSGALLLGISLVYGPVFSTSTAFIIFTLLGFFLGGSSLGFPLVGQYIPSSLKGTGFGLMTAMGYLLCALLEYIIGALLSDQTTSSVAMDKFKIALTPLVIILILGWICTLCLKEVKKAD